jgi:chromosome segregation ATPase
MANITKQEFNKKITELNNNFVKSLRNLNKYFNEELTSIKDNISNTQESLQELHKKIDTIDQKEEDTVSEEKLVEELNKVKDEKISRREFNKHIVILDAKVQNLKEDIEELEKSVSDGEEMIMNTNIHIQGKKNSVT